ncbi:MAG: peptide-methionine (S)-S-oxide reductase MsrA, partial [Verrucomicrobiaceae bacterium]
MFFRTKPTAVPTAAEALPGRDTEMTVTSQHFVNGADLKGPHPEGAETVYFGLGCFWGAERLFWTLPGVVVTAVGYQGGHTPNASYEEVCSGRTGHTESVKVVYDPKTISLETLLKTFWEEHDPTQGMRQGNDVGTQYRSAIYTTTPEQAEIVAASKAMYEKALREKGLGAITT